MSRLSVLLVGVSFAVAAAPVRFLVAPAGDDGADGVNAPFATLARARDAARASRQAGELPRGAEIVLAAGVYDLLEPVVFGPEDAGTMDAPLLVRAAGAEKPVLRGGPTLRGFVPYRGEILQCDLHALGLGEQDFNQLFFRGRRMPLARTPNLDPEDIHGGTWAHALGGVGTNPQRAFRYGEDIDPSGWANPEEASVGIFCRFDWRWNWRRVRSIDLRSKTIELASNATYEISIGDRYLVQNVFEELDAPGEWYLDRRAGVVYFWPPEPLREGDVSVAVSPSLIRLDDTAFVSVRGLILEGCVANGAVLAHARDCRVEGCEIRNTGGWGVQVEGGERNLIFGCDIHHLGRGGILLGGGDRKTLARGENRAENNVIHHNGVFEKTYNTGINISGVGNAAVHNLIYHTPHAGMTLGGNDNLVEFNIIHHTNLESTDTGGIYSCPRDWTARGNTIRYNIWHDIGGFGKRSSWTPVENGLVHFEYPHYTWGIYMDDPTSGNTIFGNILYRVPISGMHNHGGRDNLFANNVLVDCPAFQAGMLSPNWTAWPSIVDRLREYAGPGSPYLDHYPALREYREERPEAMTGLAFRHNIVYLTRDGTEWLRQHRGWGERIQLYGYRNHQDFIPDNEFDRNLFYWEEGVEPFIRYHPIPESQREITWEEWRQTGADANSRVADPLFVDPANLDFRLRPESPALELGFQPIPVERIGPYADPQRASWPIVQDDTAARQARPIVRAYDIYPRTKAMQIAVRDGIPRTIARLKAGETVRIAYFGGGIHGADGWRRLYLDHLRRSYPEATIEEIHAGVCDCVRGSGYSVWRYADEVLDKNPDLVLVDFVSEDHTTAPPAIQRAIEGVVRQTGRRSPAPELLFFYAFRPGVESAYAEGDCPPHVAAYEQLAEHYGIPSANAGYAISQAIQAGELVARGDANAFSADGVRPSGEANRRYAEVLNAAFAALAEATSPRPAELPDPLTTDHLENARQVPITPDMLQGEWNRVPIAESPVPQLRQHFDALWTTRQPGATLTFTFTGRQAGLTLLIGPDIGRYQVTVNGRQTSVQGRADRWCYYHRQSAATLAANLPPGEHTVSIELLADPPDRSEPIAEAQRLDRYDEDMFKGVALMIGNLRVLE